jgi:ribosomal protein L11 methyltransferase
MSWIEIRLNIPRQKAEDISAYLFAMGCAGIHQDEHEIIIYFSKYNWSEEIRAGLVGYIGRIIPAFKRRQMQVKALSDQDWNNNWKQYFKPVRITRKIVVLPPWENYHPQPGDVRIVIDPQMAFGTGQHESTQLMIQVLEKELKAGMKVFDVGTGSGILAIVADKLGAGSVVAVDSDEDAFHNAVQNSILNSVSAGVHIMLSPLENVPRQKCDLVLANINKNTLLTCADLFADFLSEQGRLILSGILVADEPKMVAEYTKHGFHLLAKRVKKEWLSLTFKYGAKNRGDKTGGHRPGYKFGPVADRTIH